MTEVPAVDNVDGDTVGRGATSFASATRWSYVMDGGRQVMTTVVTFILANQLGPEVFGIAAMALVYVQLIEMLQRQGIAAALIQRSELRQAHLYSAFWAILGASVTLTLVSIALAGWWADVNDLPGLAKVIMVLSLLIPLQALVIVHEAILRRAMDFRSLAIRTNVAVITAGAIAITLAYTGAGVWALVAQQLINIGLGGVLLWMLCDWRPRFSFSRPAMGDLLGFSLRSFAATVAVFIGNRSDALLIGLFFGAKAVGLYYFASRLITMVTDLAAKALQGASLPELSRLQATPDKFRERTMSIISLSALITFPLLAVVAGASEEIVAILGEAEWGPAATVLRLLTLVGAVRAITLITGPMLQALGRPGALAKLSWAGAILSAGTFVVVGLLLSEESLETQVVGLALSRVLVHVCFIAMYLFPLRAIVRNPWRNVAQEAGPVILISLFGFMTAWLCSSFVQSMPALVRLVLVAGTGTAVIAVLLVRFDDRVRSAALGISRTLRSTGA